MNPIIDSSSSSFSDESFTASTAFTKDGNDKRNSKTEPTKKKTNYMKINNNNNNNNRKLSSSPCKTPPWKPMSSLYAYNTDNTPVGPTRLKFDDYDDQLVKLKTTTTSFMNNYFLDDLSTNTNHPVPTDENLCLKLSFK